MKIELTLNEAYARASEELRRKMQYSIYLLQKAERLALAYDCRGGTSQNPIRNGGSAGFQIAPRLTA